MSEAKRQDILVQLHRALPRTGSLTALVLSGVVIVICALLKFLLDDWIGSPLPPFITFYPAVVFAGLLGGPACGLAGAAATLALAWYFRMPPTLSFALDRETVVTVGIYTLTAPLIALTVGAARLSVDRAAASEAERATAARESVHRTKNLVAVFQALASKVAREVNTVPEFEVILGQRLHALGLAQNLLLRRNWQDVDLEEVLQTALAPFLPNPGLTIRSGEHVVVPARHVRGVCMALYELCTNAMKYGALAYGRGPATLSWHLVDNDCILEWREELTGNERARPDQPGFGTMLIRMALSHDAGTTVHYEVNATRVLASFRWPQATRAKRPLLEESPQRDQGLPQTPHRANQAAWPRIEAVLSFYLLGQFFVFARDAEQRLLRTGIDPSPG